MAEHEEEYFSEDADDEDNNTAHGAQLAGGSSHGNAAEMSLVVGEYGGTADVGEDDDNAPHGPWRDDRIDDYDDDTEGERACFRTHRDVELLRKDSDRSYHV